MLEQAFVGAQPSPLPRFPCRLKVMLEQAFVGAQLHLPLDNTYWHGSDASYMALCLEVGHLSVNLKS